MRYAYVFINETDYISHYGVKGMKWGVRKTRREATKDAKRYTKAKMFYGEGAGTNRKLLNAELKPKMKDPTYKKFFDDAVANADTAGAARQARVKRKTIDTAKTAKRYTKKALKIVGPVALTAGTAYYAANKTRVDNAVKNMYNKAANEVKRRKNARKINQNWRVEK